MSYFNSDQREDTTYNTLTEFPHFSVKKKEKEKSHEIKLLFLPQQKNSLQIFRDNI